MVGFVGGDSGGFGGDPEHESGYPLVLNKPPTLVGLAFEQAAWRLAEQDSRQAVMMEEELKNRGWFSFFGG